MDRSSAFAASWVTIYDGPRRLLSLIATGTDRESWAPLDRDATRSQEGGYTTWTAPGSSDPLLVEVVLRENGYPVDPPEFLDPAAFGSPTVWPQEQNHYIWWHEHSPFSSGDTEFKNPWPEWSPDAPHGAAPRIKPD